MGWFYRAEDQSEIGPVATSIVRKLAEIGKITPATMMRREDSDRWLKAKRIKGLFGEPDEYGAVATAVREPASSARKRTRDDAPYRREESESDPQSLLSRLIVPGRPALLAVMAFLSLVALVSVFGRMMALGSTATAGRALALWEMYGRIGCTAWLSFVVAVAGIALSSPGRTD